MRKVMVFGTFDGLHAGHRAFLREASHHGDYLIVVVAPNHVAEHLKGKKPVSDIADRLEELRSEDGVSEVVVGDSELGTWEVIQLYHPDVIALGYDQKELLKSLESHLETARRRPEIVIMSAHEPDKYHSNIIRNGEKV